MPYVNPQNPVTAGMTGHLNDHDDIANILTTLEGLVPTPATNGYVLTATGTSTAAWSPPGAVSTVTVPNGGTGDTSLTPYAVLCGGTTSTGAVQSVAGVGTSGQILTSNGAGALPTFQAAPSSGLTQGKAYPMVLLRTMP